MGDNPKQEVLIQEMGEMRRGYEAQIQRNEALSSETARLSSENSLLKAELANARNENQRLQDALARQQNQPS
jgi:predicted nuclease with TOPRIM domain